MFIELIRPVDDLRLGPRAPAGMVTGVMDDLGRRLVDEGAAVELTTAEFHRRLTGPESRTCILTDNHN